MVPFKNLRTESSFNKNEGILHTLVPYFDLSFDAPTTAKYGELTKSFGIEVMKQLNAAALSLHSVTIIDHHHHDSWRYYM